MTAQSILERKGYNNTECIGILQSNSDNLDMKIRQKYGLENQALHLWESYYIGDADIEKVEAIAIEKGFENSDSLLLRMDRELIDLANDYPDKSIDIDESELIDELKNEIENAHGGFTGWGIDVLLDTETNSIISSSVNSGQQMYKASSIRLIRIDCWSVEDLEGEHEDESEAIDYFKEEYSTRFLEQIKENEYERTINII